MAASKIPVWIKQCLDQYGNCACGRAITKKIGKAKLLLKNRQPLLADEDEDDE